MNPAFFKSVHLRFLLHKRKVTQEERKKGIAITLSLCLVSKPLSYIETGLRGGNVMDSESEGSSRVLSPSPSCMVIR